MAGTNPASRALRSLPSADKKFGWQDVTNETYLDYVASLRAVGCPEKQIRGIVVADVNDLFDRRRLEHAVKTDPQWTHHPSGVAKINNVLVGQGALDLPYHGETADAAIEDADGQRGFFGQRCLRGRTVHGSTILR